MCGRIRIIRIVKKKRRITIHHPTEAGVVVLLRVDFFQNGCHCHGNGQNAKKLKNTKIIIAGYSPNRN
jgi:hypothetical protein